MCGSRLARLVILTIGIAIRWVYAGSIALPFENSVRSRTVISAHISLRAGILDHTKDDHANSNHLKQGDKMKGSPL